MRNEIENFIYKIDQLPIFIVFKYKWFFANDLRYLFTFTIIARNNATIIIRTIIAFAAIVIFTQIHFD